jgi:hypothetical protein
MLKWLKKLFFKPREKEQEQDNADLVSAQLVFGSINKEEESPDSGILEAPAPAPDPAQPPVPALDPAQPPVPVPALDPALDPDSSQPPVEVLASPRGPASDSDNPIINSINLLVDSIFKKDDDDFVLLKNYFFSIFTPPEDPKVDDKKSIALTAPSPTLEQEKELKETLEKCALSYHYNLEIPPPGPSDPQSESTKTTSKLSQILKEKAEPLVYFGVGIKTELEDVEGQKFLKITDIFSNSNLRNEKQGDADYTNQFITHLFCKLENDTEIKEYSIADIFNKFKDKDSASAQEKFDEKIDQIFRDINQTSIKFKISASKSQTDPATQPADVTVDKIIFEKTKGVYQQKTMTPSTITAIRDAEGRGVGAVVGVGAGGMAA